MTEQLNIRVNKELVEELEELASNINIDRVSLARKILIEGVKRERLNFAVQKYLNKEISIEKAAELAGLSLYEIIEVFSRLGLSSNLSLEDIKKTIDL